MLCPTERGQPYQAVDPKRSNDNVEVSFDWHDYLANKRASGIEININSRIRLTRARSKGLQFRSVNDGGVTGRREPVWPTVVGGQVQDGTVLWEGELITQQSLRTTIATSVFPVVDGVTLSSPTNSDLLYRILVDGGQSGQDYEIRHQVVMVNGEKKEGVALLSVID